MIHGTTIQLAREADTIALATALAPSLQAGDCLLLSGEIGAGKSAFARALIRARLSRMEDVPSPTFTLVQTYDAPDGDIWHLDLYRLTSPDEAMELGLDDALGTAICLIEWPDRLDNLVPKNASALTFEVLENSHQVTINLSQDVQQRHHGS